MGSGQPITDPFLGFMHQPRYGRPALALDLMEEFRPLIADSVAISLVNRHPRINILSPGPGVGGHCISVDPWFFVESAPELSRLILRARQVNDSQPEFVLDLLRKTLGSLQGRKIAALGLAYKPDVDDLRESPAVEVVRLLEQAGAQVKAFEPFKPQPNLPGVDAAPSLEMALEQAEAVILLVNHSEFRALTPAQLKSMTPARVLVDTVDGWAGQDWAAQGFTLARLGVGSPSA